MSSNSPNTPKIITDVVDAAAANQQVSLDVNDFAEVADKPTVVMERANATLHSREQWEALQKTIEQEKNDPENQMVLDDAASNTKLAELDAEIAQAVNSAPPTPTNIADASHKLESSFGQVWEKVTKIFDGLGEKTLSSITFLLEMLGVKSWADLLKEKFIEPKRIRSHMGEKLNAPIVRNQQDAANLKTLRAQYQAKLETDKKTADAYTFEMFYTEKIDTLAKSPKKKLYTIGDLINIASPEQAKVLEDQKKKNDEADAQKQKENEEKDQAKKLAEAMEKDRERTTLQLFCEALNEVKPNAVSLEDKDTMADIASKIRQAFSEVDNRGFFDFGLEVSSDGDLEEADGTANPLIGVDWDILSYWGKKLEENPLGAIHDFLSVDPEKWKSTNEPAARTFEKVRAYMEKKGVTATTLTSGQAPKGAATPPAKKSPPAPSTPEPDFTPPMM